MSLNQIDKDAEEIFGIYKTKGVKEAAKRFEEIIREKDLVQWVALALRAKVADKIADHKKEGRK